MYRGILSIFLTLFVAIYSGLHLKHARNPAKSAFLLLSKIIIFLRSGVRDLQLGLQ